MKRFRRTRFAAVIAAAGVWLVWAGPAAAQLGLAEESEPAAAEASEAEAERTSPEAIADRRAALAEELASVEQALASAGDPDRREHLEEVRERLRQIGALLRDQSERVTSQPVDGEAGGAQIAEEPPSVFALDRLLGARFELENESQRRDQVQEARRAALAEAKEKLQEAERRRREAKAELEAAAGAERAPAERRLELRRLESRLAEEHVTLATLELRSQGAAGGDAALAALDERIESMRAAIARGEGSPAEGLSETAELEAALHREREAAERRLSAVELRLDAARQRFSRQADPPRAALEEVEALGARRDLIRREIALVEARLERLEAQRSVWVHWSALLRGEGRRADHEAWQQEVEERVEALSREALSREGRRVDAEERLESLQNRLARLAPDDPLRPVLDDQRAALERLLAAERIEAASLAEDRRTSERALADLRAATGDLDLLAWAGRALEQLVDIWGYEITAVDDAPITVGSLALALLLALVGWWASRRGSQFVGGVATRRFRLEQGAADALQTLSFYVLLVSFTLLALRAVHFPLTAFTVLGGALAIGIGFGSQNVMNNFISGLILMLERPVRTGDVVEVDQNHGTIEKIGARSTQIRSLDGRYIVVPNAFFLENNVVNWTLSDELVRTSVLVGVIYGSPTRLVRDLILQVVQGDEEILKTPEPVILFDEFGDNSLNFEVFFWIRSRSPMGMRKVQSRVRYEIDDLFREHGLVIAFPQRDVHLDSVSPIEVRVVDGKGEKPASRDPEA